MFPGAFTLCQSSRVRARVRVEFKETRSRVTLEVIYLDEFACLLSRISWRVYEEQTLEDSIGSSEPGKTPRPASHGGRPTTKQAAHDKHPTRRRSEAPTNQEHQRAQPAEGKAAETTARAGPGRQRERGHKASSGTPKEGGHRKRSPTTRAHQGKRPAAETPKDTQAKSPSAPEQQSPGNGRAARQSQAAREGARPNNCGQQRREATKRAARTVRAPAQQSANSRERKGQRALGGPTELRPAGEQQAEASRKPAGRAAATGAGPAKETRSRRTGEEQPEKCDRETNRAPPTVVGPEHRRPKNKGGQGMPNGATARRKGPQTARGPGETRERQQGAGLRREARRAGTRRSNAGGPPKPRQKAANQMEAAAQPRERAREGQEAQSARRQSRRETASVLSPGGR